MATPRYRTDVEDVDTYVPTIRPDQPPKGVKPSATTRRRGETRGEQDLRMEGFTDEQIGYYNPRVGRGGGFGQSAAIAKEREARLAKQQEVDNWYMERERQLKEGQFEFEKSNKILEQSAASAVQNAATQWNGELAEIMDQFGYGTPEFYRAALRTSFKYPQLARHEIAKGMIDKFSTELGEAVGGEDKFGQDTVAKTKGEVSPVIDPRTGRADIAATEREVAAWEAKQATLTKTRGQVSPVIDPNTGRVDTAATEKAVAAWELNQAKTAPIVAPGMQTKTVTTGPTGTTVTSERAQTPDDIIDEWTQVQSADKVDDATKIESSYAAARRLIALGKSPRPMFRSLHDRIETLWETEKDPVKKADAEHRLNFYKKELGYELIGDKVAEEPDELKTTATPKTLEAGPPDPNAIVPKQPVAIGGGITVGGGVTTKEEYDALPSGAEFTFKGRKGRKP